MKEVKRILEIRKKGGRINEHEFATVYQTTTGKKFLGNISIKYLQECCDEMEEILKKKETPIQETVVVVDPVVDSMQETKMEEAIKKTNEYAGKRKKGRK